MTARISRIWRHPVKSHGRETLDQVTLTAGRTLPGDRLWAVAHEASTADGSAWVPCANFTRAAKVGALNAVSAVLDDATGRIVFRHPDLPPLDIDPETEGQRLIDWTRPLMPEDRAQSARLVQVPGRGMTDTAFPSISLLNAASNAGVSTQAGAELSPERWRGNFLIEGLDPWAEWDWIGRDLRLGEAVLHVEQRITRCNATKANPATGRTDADTLSALKTGWGHQDFGIYATVTEGGRVAVGDRLELL
jgi:uncharacterized protein YcbX